MIKNRPERLIGCVRVLLLFTNNCSLCWWRIMDLIYLGYSFVWGWNKQLFLWYLWFPHFISIFFRSRKVLCRKSFQLRIKDKWFSQTRGAREEPSQLFTRQQYQRREVIKDPENNSLVWFNLFCCNLAFHFVVVCSFNKLILFKNGFPENGHLILETTQNINKHEIFSYYILWYKYLSVINSTNLHSLCRWINL